MGRKRIVDMGTYKFSLNISGENKATVDIATDNLGIKYGPFINLLIRSICRMPESMKNAFINFCMDQCKKLNDQILHAGAFDKKALEEEKARYLEIARLINGGVKLNLEQEVDSDPTMQKLALKDGVLIIPKDWIVLNPEDAKNCLYAGVVECRNSAKYGIPHFCFFTNKQYGNEYDQALQDYINKLCCEKWPKFEKIMQQEVKPIPDSENKGQYLNSKEYLASPAIGHFHILATDDKLYDNDPPYGAVIIRNQTCDEN